MVELSRQWVFKIDKWIQSAEEEAKEAREAEQLRQQAGT